MRVQIDLERFLAITAVLASSGLAIAGCSSSSSGGLPDGGAGGFGNGGSGGSGGSGGAATCSDYSGEWSISGSCGVSVCTLAQTGCSFQMYCDDGSVQSGSIDGSNITFGTDGVTCYGTISGTTASGTCSTLDGNCDWNATVVSGSGGAGGSGGVGTGGAGGNGGTGGVGGTGGIGGTGGVGGTGGSTQCFGDAGTEGFCGDLPYYAVDCGVETPPLGAQLCDYAYLNARAGVAEAMHQCLANINVADPCGSAHETAVQNCLNAVYGNVCDPTDPQHQADTLCPQVNAACAGISTADCLVGTNPLTAAASYAVFQCFNTGTGDCQDDWWACLGLP